MGATTFQTISYGKSRAEAFQRAQEQARWEDGHGGYSGTIAEKPSASVYGGGEVTYRQAQRIIRDLEAEEQAAAEKACQPPYVDPPVSTAARVYADKWGPALAIRIKRSSLPDAFKRQAPARGVQFWMFAGWAST